MAAPEGVPLGHPPAASWERWVWARHVHGRLGIWECNAVRVRVRVHL